MDSSDVIFFNIVIIICIEPGCAILMFGLWDKSNSIGIPNNQMPLISSMEFHSAIQAAG